MSDFSFSPPFFLTKTRCCTVKQHRGFSFYWGNSAIDPFVIPDQQTATIRSIRHAAQKRLAKAPMGKQSNLFLSKEPILAIYNSGLL